MNIVSLPSFSCVLFFFLLPFRSHGYAHRFIFLLLRSLLGVSLAKEQRWLDLLSAEGPHHKKGVLVRKRVSSRVSYLEVRRVNQV